MYKEFWDIYYSKANELHELMLAIVLVNKRGIHT